MTVGLFQLAIIALVLLVLFGRGRISATMGDVGKGIRSFRKELDGNDEVSPVEREPTRAEPQAVENAN
jgi:sec-independent protein translocase protein TatA